MGVALSDLIEQIGLSVQKANALMEQMAVAAYLGQGYENERNGDDGEEEFVPVRFAIRVPDAAGEKTIQAPVTALMHHTSLKLEQVDVKLRFLIEESKEDAVMVSLKSPEDAAYSVLSELSLQFKSAPPAEGMARVDYHHVQAL